MYYTIQNDGILTAESEYALSRFYDNVQLLPNDYEVGKYVIKNDELVRNENYEAEQEQKERERIQELSMTRSDFFDGTIMAWGVGQDELLVLIQGLLATLPLENVKKLIAINNFKNALNFYRKHDLFNMLVNIPIQLTETVQVVITEESLDKFFDEVDKGNKVTAWEYLPKPILIPVEEDLQVEIDEELPAEEIVLPEEATEVEDENTTDSSI